MSIRYRNATKTSRLTATATDFGSTPILQLWAGSIPAGPDVAMTGSPLAVITCTAAPTVSGSTLTFNGISTDVLATAAGTVTFVRILNGTNAIADVDAGGPGSGKDFIISPSAALVVNQDVQITSGTISHA